MSGLLEKAEKNLNVALDTIANMAEHFAEKTQETAKVTHLRVRIRRDQYAMSKLLSRFGVLVYGKVVKHKKLSLESPEVTELAAKIAELEKRIEDALKLIDKAAGAESAAVKPAAPKKTAAKKAAPKKTAAKKAAPKKTAVAPKRVRKKTAEKKA